MLTLMVALVALPSQGFADPGRKPLVAVLELVSNTHRITDHEAQYLTDTLRGAIREALDKDSFDIMTRENMDVLVPPQALRQCDSGRCIVEIGKKLQADFVIGGTVTDVAGRMAFTLQGYESRSGALTGSEQGDSDTVFGLLDRIRKVAPELASKLTPGNGGRGNPATMDTRVAPLLIRSNPPGASILLDGRQLGRTPWQEPAVTAARHKLTLFLDGFQQWDGKVDVTAEKTATVDADLVPILGALTVSAAMDSNGQAVPIQAAFSIDGQPQGTTPAIVKLSSTEHEVRVDYQGVARSVRIRVVPNAVTEARLQFESSSVLAQRAMAEALARRQQAELDARDSHEAQQARQEAEERDVTLFRSWDTDLAGLGPAPVAGRFFTTSGGHRMVLPLTLVGYGMNWHTKVVAMAFGVGTAGMGAGAEPGGTMVAHGMMFPVEGDITFRFAKGFPLGLRVGVAGFLDMWSSSREIGSLLVGMATAHLVYDFGVLVDRVHFEVAAGFEYAGWKSRWDATSDHGNVSSTSDSGGDPMGGARVLVTIPIAELESGRELRMVLAAGYYRGPEGAQDVQWTFHFRYYRF